MMTVFVNVYNIFKNFSLTDTENTLILTISNLRIFSHKIVTNFSSFFRSFLLLSCYPKCG